MSLQRITPFGWLVAASFAFGLGFGVYLTLFVNFVAQDLQIRPDQLGLLESIREIPGLLTIVLAAIVMTVAEPRVGAIALVLLGAGWINYFHLNSIEALIGFSLLASVGFHMWMPVANTLALRLSDPSVQGRRLGQIRSVQAVAQLVGIGLVGLLAGTTGLRPLFILSGAMIMVGGLLLANIRNLESPVVQPRIVLRRRYGLYYALTCLDGARRHVFMTFAIFLLVREFGIQVQTVALLGLVNGVVTMAAAYGFGRLIDRVGERRVLMVGFGALSLIFLGYATIPVVGVLFALYVLDNMFFSAEVGITTYLRKILVVPSDLRPSVVAGQTFNHVAAVIVPVTGGVLWATYGHQVVFIGGSILAVVSMLLSARIRVPRPAAAGERAPEPSPTI